MKTSEAQFESKVEFLPAGKQGSRQQSWSGSHGHICQLAGWFHAACSE
jgi:hypothetical protein